MKIICQAAKDDGSGFHEIGTTHQTIFSHYKTLVNAIKHGCKPWAGQHGCVARCLYYIDGNIHKEQPDRIFYIQSGHTYFSAQVESSIWIFLPRENAMGFTARQITNELRIFDPTIIDDVLERMMADRISQLGDALEQINSELPDRAEKFANKVIQRINAVPLTVQGAECYNCGADVKEEDKSCWDCGAHFG